MAYISGSFTTGIDALVGSFSITYAKASGKITITPAPLVGKFTPEYAKVSGKITITPAPLSGLISVERSKLAGKFKTTPAVLQGVFTITSDTVQGSISLEFDVNCEDGTYVITDVTDYDAEELVRGDLGLSISIKEVKTGTPLDYTPDSGDITVVSEWSGVIPTENNGDPVDKFYEVIVTDDNTGDVVATEYLALTCKTKKMVDEIEEYIATKCVCEDSSDIYFHYLSIAGLYAGVMAANRTANHTDAYKFLDDVSDAYSDFKKEYEYDIS